MLFERVADRRLESRSVRFQAVRPQVGTEQLLGALEVVEEERQGGRAVAPGRQHLTETVASYLDHHMSIQETARALYLHPNTVAYRLSRIRELTGFDPRRPRELMMFWLAGRVLGNRRT